MNSTVQEIKCIRCGKKEKVQAVQELQEKICGECWCKQYARREGKMRLYTFAVNFPKGSKITVLSSCVTDAQRIAERLAVSMLHVQLIEEEVVEDTREGYLEAVKKVTVPETSSFPS